MYNVRKSRLSWKCCCYFAALPSADYFDERALLERFVLAPAAVIPFVA